MTEPTSNPNERGKPFFHSTHEHRFIQSMGWVTGGFLSDPIGVELYMPLYKTTDGLQIYRCLRTSSPLEGYHLHLRQTLVAQSRGAGIHWKESVVNGFDWKWTVNRLKDAGLLSQRVQHYNFTLLELLLSLQKKAFGKETDLIPGFKRARDDNNTIELRRSYDYYFQTLETSPPLVPPPVVAIHDDDDDDDDDKPITSLLKTPPTNALRPSHSKVVAKLTNISNVRSYVSPSAAKALLATPLAARNPSVMSKAAGKLGIVMDASGSEKFVKHALNSQRATEVLNGPKVSYFSISNKLKSAKAENTGRVASVPSADHLKNDSSSIGGNVPSLFCRQEAISLPFDNGAEEIVMVDNTQDFDDVEVDDVDIAAVARKRKSEKQRERRSRLPSQERDSMNEERRKKRKPEPSNQTGVLGSLPLPEGVEEEREEGNESEKGTPV